VNEGVRILIADEHSLFRDAVRRVLTTNGEFEVVAEARDSMEAVITAERTRPDVVVVDATLPNGDGVRAVRLIRERVPDARVVVLSDCGDVDVLADAVEAGAAGYLLKGAPRADIFAAVRVVAAGGSLLAPVAASTVLRRVRGAAGDQPGPGPAAAAPALTPRERAVLEHLARGLANKQIAAALGVSERTVKFHVSSVFAKLGASNRTEAVARAAQAGLVRL
jgi:DNA-binding NarL/FixJ family response regulator